MKSKKHLIRKFITLFNIFTCIACINVLAQNPVTDFARDLLNKSGTNISRYKLVDNLGHDEAFRIVQDNKDITIEYQTPAGILYGTQAVIRNEYVPDQIEKPDFQIRGTTLPMFKGKGYKATLSQETFPWFYDRDFMIRTLDVFTEARINTIFLWGSHTFPYIVEMPEYPEASADVSPEQVKANQEQFFWFTSECEKRNIKVLLHFYNIHITQAFADAHNIPWKPEVPSPLLNAYTHYALSRYFEVFPSVGLYACPGETIKSEHQLEWFSEVIFDAAKKSGKNPPIVLRDWTLNHDFRDQLKSLYSNLFSELKQNDESLSSPYPDIRHMKWEGLTSGHIINAAHGPAEDLVPMRWANPLFVKEMAQHWKSLGFVSGVEFWGQAFWDWPYTYDKVSPRLKYIERDAPFYEVIGRYMWKADRDDVEEHEFWINYFSKLFESKKTGRLIAQWFEVSGSIGPGLLNLNATRVANWWSAVTLMNQSVDEILEYNKKLDQTPYTLNREAGRAKQRFYPRPFDELFFNLYQKKYKLPLAGKNPEMFKEFYPYAERMQIEDLAQRKCMPVSQYAGFLVENKTVDFALTPDRVIQLLNDLANESLDLAEKAKKAAGNSPHMEELDRFVNDSKIFVLATEAMKAKEKAAILKACILLENEYSEQTADEFLAAMEESVIKYKELFDLGQASYSKASFRMDWEPGLKEFEEDLENQRKWLIEFKKHIQRPNIVFVYSDQQSSDMLGCYGNLDLITPNLDELADQGVRFEHCISSSPICSPYRSMLFSGEHTLRNGSFGNDIRMEPGQGNYFAEVLRDKGYRTGYYGKWHLYGGDRNRPIPPGPYRYGFDHKFLSNNCTVLSLGSG